MSPVDSLRTETKFKKTEIGEIPVDWELVKLREIAIITMGQSPPSSSSYDYKNGLPFFQGKAEFGTKYPRVVKWCCSPTKIAEEGDILISVRAPVGDVNIAPKKSCIGRGLAAIRGIKSDNEYLYHIMNFFKRRLAKIGQGSTFEAINKNDLYELTIPYPPVSEQKRIAQILTSLDEALEKKREIIERTKELKKGLMQELLTHGIGHTKFKKTEIGEIPVEWRTKKLNEIGKLKGGSGFPEKFQGYPDREYSFIKVSDMNLPGNEVYMKNSMNTIDINTTEDLGCHIFPKDTIIFAKVGAALLLNRRRILTRESCIDNNMMGLEIYKENDPRFYYYIMQTIDFADYVFSGALPSVNQAVLGNIKVVNPPLNEQFSISRILISIDEKIEAQNAHLKEIEKIKIGLTLTLLTGKLRVRY